MILLPPPHPRPHRHTDEAGRCLRGAGAQGVCGAAKALGTGSLATFCSTRLLSQQPQCGPPGMGARARSLSWGFCCHRCCGGSAGRWPGLGSQSQPLELCRRHSPAPSATRRQARGQVCAFPAPDSLPLPHSWPAGPPEHKPLLPRGPGLGGALVPDSSHMGTPGGWPAVAAQLPAQGDNVCHDSKSPNFCSACLYPVTAEQSRLLRETSV